MKIFRLITFFIVFIPVLTFPLRAEVMRGETSCGGISAEASGTDFGPYDYRSAPPEKLHRVEKYHFTRNIENLKSGESTSVIGRELDFTLRYFPNHARALNAMEKLAQREKTDQPRGSSYSIACLFDRALRMAPDDAQVSILYGFWLIKKGERTLALEQFEKVRSSESRTANINYNLGLGYFELKEYDKSLRAAHEAYGSGFSLPGLRIKLQKVGKWRDAAIEHSAEKSDIKGETNVLPDNK